MARGRFVSKLISLDERVNALPNDTTRLLFTWLIPHLDCEGRMYGDAQTVKSIVFPRRCMDVRSLQKHLDALVQSGLVLRYSNGGSTFICCPGFAKHQPGLNKSRESPSQIPPPPPDLLQSNVLESPTEVKVKVKDKVYTYTVFDHWNQQNLVIHKKLTPQITTAIERALESYSVEDLKAAISNYAEIVHGPEYYFKYKWTLVDFLKRGVDKFSDLEVARSNYRRDERGKTRHSRELPKVYTKPPVYPEDR